MGNRQQDVSKTFDRESPIKKRNMPEQQKPLYDPKVTYEKKTKENFTKNVGGEQKVKVTQTKVSSKDKGLAGKSSNVLDENVMSFNENDDSYIKKNIKALTARSVLSRSAESQRSIHSQSNSQDLKIRSSNKIRKSQREGLDFDLWGHKEQGSALYVKKANNYA